MKHVINSVTPVRMIVYLFAGTVSWIQFGIYTITAHQGITLVITGLLALILTVAFTVLDRTKATLDIECEFPAHKTVYKIAIFCWGAIAFMDFLQYFSPPTIGS